jgi:4-hydroxy-4-methyl-2-oxoglutarate aldolase
LKGATKQHPGRIGGQALVGDVLVQQGDWIVADADGVTVIPHTKLDDVLAAGQVREAKEAGFFEALRAGKTTIELLALDTKPITRD